MNIELMGLWNDTKTDGPRWEDLPIVEQQRLEDFADAVAAEGSVEAVERLEDDLKDARRTIKEQEAELTKLRASKS